MEAGHELIQMSADVQTSR